MNGIKAFSGVALAIMLAGCQSAPETSKQTQAEVKTQGPLPSYAQVTFPEGETADGTKYNSGKADLNGDGSDEILILMEGMEYCGTGGCTAFIIDSDNNQIARMTVTELPIMLGHRETNGWKNLIVWSNGYLRLVKHDGTSYPSNPSTMPRYNQESNKKRAMTFLTSSPEYQADGYGISYYEDTPILLPVSQFKYKFKSESSPTVHYKAVVDSLTGSVDIERIDTHHDQ
ncbi:membrane protein [Vibrio ishigakensis]|uniref:Membrane protein n=1 Tax=Vibrio ishigakensis TaxID=1481914 RepID=A0A0B8P1C3_9VIBR|nr:hypothetical protein [Vibrio ishigakensis]GAM57128.1 membrane protein [Vibrio ishigakensis]